MSALDKLERVEITVDGVTLTVVGGSFKGIPFFVEEYEKTGDGRNIVARPIPGSSDYIVEDLGGKIPNYPLEIYLVGDECLAARDNLIAVCNEEGPGELVHPFFGRFTANCTALTFRGSRSGVNYCTAQIEFQPVNANEGRAVQTDLAGLTKKAAADFQQKSVDRFATAFSIIGKGKSVVDQAVAVTTRAVDAVLSARSVLAVANDFVSEIGKIKANATVLMLAPGDFAARLQNLVTATKEMFGVEDDSGNSVDEYLAMLEKIRTEEIDETPAGRISALMKNLAAAQITASLVDAEFSNVEDAVACQNRISDAFDWLLDSVDDADDYMAISNLQSSAFGYLRTAMANIAVVLEKTLTSSENVLQLCYDVYGSVDRVDEIMDRNALIQGLFVLPGKVKVLSK